MAGNVKSTGSIVIAHAGVDWSKSQSKTAFKKESNWVVRRSDDSSRRYSTVVSNLLCNDRFSDDLKVEDVREVLESGFKKQTFERLKLLLDVNSAELAKVIRVPTRTIARRVGFKADESERILRVAKVFHRSIEVMEDLEQARQWFKTPKKALGEKTPFEFCNTDIGANAVINLLGRIEHGVFT